MATFLLELRSEEIPANALPGAREQLTSGFASRLAAAGFGDVAVTALSTNRRLAVLAHGLPLAQADRVEELTGPPARVAFGPDGTPTKAAEGFAKKAGVELAALKKVTTDKGDYVGATVTVRGRATAELLAEITTEVVAGLKFPKVMRWGLGRHQFVRPVHGVVALLDDRVLPLELFGVASGRSTVGHRVHAPAAFDLAPAEDYQAALAERHVVVDPALRQRSLTTLAERLAAELGCTVHPDPALVAEHVELVECPGLVRGAIAERFLALPSEVVVMTLRHHQKCLVLEQDGALSPHFLAVVDRSDDPVGLIRVGNEWVIGARLADASFFFAEDRKRRLDDLVPGLERVEFHRRLGSLAAKAERVGDLAVTLAGLAGLDVAADELRRAARLAKADLATGMVGEFPELQGVMGGHYLRLQGEPEALWTAARDHYQPAAIDGAPPASELGRLVAVADRLDTLASLFAVGELPSGSRDPFSLRRAAQGVVRTAAAAGWSLDLEQALLAAISEVTTALDTIPEDLATSLTAFMAERVRRYLVEVTGVSPDTADAVVAASWSQPSDAEARARALEAVRGSDRFRALALAFKRVRNITAEHPAAAVDPALLSSGDEQALAAATVRFQAALTELLPARRLAEAFAAMGELAPVLDQFFVSVMVMCDDPAVRANRIALLANLREDFLTLADLSRLQVEGGKE